MPNQSPRPAAPAIDRSPSALRFLPLALLLALEVWILRERFTTDALLGRDLPWVPVLRAARFNLPWGLAVLAAVAACGLRRWSSVFETLSASAPEARVRLKAALVHGVSFATFYLLTGWLLERELGSSASWAVLCAWTLAGVCLICSLLATSCALRPLTRALWSLRRTLCVGLVAGSAGFLAADHLSETWPYADPLVRGTLWLSHAFLSFLVEACVYDAEACVLGTASFPVHVTKSCSGYEGVSLFLVFFGLFLCLARERLRLARALWLLPLGALCVWILNALRIALLVVVGETVSPEVAIKGFHVYAGWPLVIAVALAAVALATRLEIFAAQSGGAARSAARVAQHTVNPTAVYLGPLLALVTAAMIGGAFTTTPRALVPLELLAAAAVLWIYRRAYPRPSERTLDLGAFLWGLLAFAAWIALHPGPDPATATPFAWQASFTPLALGLWWTAAILASVVLHPVIEELCFRGYLLRRLSRADFESLPSGQFGILALLLSSLAFGLLHANWLGGIAAGVIYALALRRRGRLSDAIVAHATTNAALLTCASLSGAWWLWS